MNIELLKKVKEYILSKPIHFNMKRGIAREPECGTVACLAGTACLLSIPDPDPKCEDGLFWWYIQTQLPLPDYGEPEKKEKEEVGWFPVRETAEHFLGLKPHQGHELFHHENWDGDYGERYDDAYNDPEERAAIAAQYIDYFISKYQKVSN